MIRECPVSLECKVVQVITLPTNSRYIGEIVGAWVEGRIVTDGKPDISKIDPLFLSMPDNRYWNLGSHVGDAWSAGKALKKGD